MQRTVVSALFATVVAGMLLAGCAGKTIKPEEQSGYLKDYSDLTETKDSKGEAFYRYVSPKFTPSNYHAVILESVEFYPKPEPTEQLSQETMNQIRDYLNQSLRQIAGDRVQLTNKPGPGVARLHVAITAVAGEKKGLKVYQFVPAAFVATMVVRGVSGTPEEARLVLEVQAVDSVSGETLLKSVRIGTGETLKKVEGQRVVTLEAVKPLIDRWAEGAGAAVTTYIQAK
jgi:hypothetical protein